MLVDISKTDLEVTITLSVDSTPLIIEALKANLIEANAATILDGYRAALRDISTETEIVCTAVLKSNNKLDLKTDIATLSGFLSASEFLELVEEYAEGDTIDIVKDSLGI